jgi:hypothetical protein
LLFLYSFYQPNASIFYLHRSYCLPVPTPQALLFAVLFIPAIFFHHRDTEDIFLFAHRETAMGKKPLPSVIIEQLI